MIDLSNIDEVLTFGNITFKASHNSYERNESIAAQLGFNQKEPYNGACMSVEFDIWRKSSDFDLYQSIDENFFRVFHTAPHINPPLGKTLKYYLNELYQFHQGNPFHDVVLVVLDIKSSGGGYHDFHHQIDTYIKCYFDESLIFKPKDIINENILPGDSLCGIVAANGWPSLKKMKGKFLFCLSGNAVWKAEYTKYDLLTHRFCFSDVDKADNDRNLIVPDKGDAVFFNFHIFQSNRHIWKKVIPAFAKHNFITRAYEVDSQENWNCCIEAKVSALATNKISHHQWAKVADNVPYIKK